MKAAVIRVAIVAAILLFAAPIAAQAQQAGRVYRLGLVTPVARSEQHDAFRQTLRELGYFEGHNLTIEARFAEGRPERIPDLVAEVVDLKVDVLVVGGYPVALAAKKATATVPIVFGGVADPVGTGIVETLPRPGGNITGISMGLEDRFAGKWLELLREAVPGISRVAVLVNRAGAMAPTYVRELQRAAHALGVKLDVVAVPLGNPAQIDEAFAAISASGAQGVIVPADPFLFAHRARLVHLAARKRLPAVYWAKAIVDDGGLMAYGPSLVGAWRQVAIHVDKILKGTKPVDLPVEQPTAFELIVNLRTARALGLTISPSLLLRADQVIE